MSSSAAATVASNVARQVVKGSRSWPHKSPALTVSFFLAYFVFAWLNFCFCLSLFLFLLVSFLLFVSFQLDFVFACLFLACFMWA